MAQATCRNLVGGIAVTFSVCCGSAYAAPGDVDTGFGRFGIASFDRRLDFSSAGNTSPPREIQLTDLKRAPGGALVAVGQLRESSDSGLRGDSSAAVVAVRYTPRGDIDQGFGDAGAFVDSSTQLDFPAVAVDGAGRAHIAAWQGPRETARAIVIRLSNRGQFDTAYGGTGRVDLGPSLRPPELALQPDGSLLVVDVVDGSGGGQNLVVWRLRPDGFADAGFGDQGRAVLPFARHAHAAAIAVQPDGKIVLAGSARAADNRYLEYLVVRLRGDGSLDQSFGDGGMLRDRFQVPGQGDIAVSNEGSAVALQPDGKIVVAGIVATDGSSPRPGLARYTADGELDESFGGDGHVVTTSLGESTVPDDGLLLSRGRILIAAQQGFSTEVVRYLGSGRTDTSFGAGGTAGVAIGSPEAIAATSDGRFVVGGGETTRCGFGLPLVSFDGVDEPDVRAIGPTHLTGRSLRIRLRGPTSKRIRGRATAIEERQTDSPQPVEYGRPCPIWSELADARFRVRGKGQVTIQLPRKAATATRREGKVVIRVTSSAGGRQGRTTRRVRVVSDQ